MFRRHNFLTGQQPRRGAGEDVVWWWTDGTPMTPEHWNSGSRVFPMWLNGAALTETDADGNVLSDDTFLILFNPSWNPRVFNLPSGLGATWTRVLDATQDTGSPALSTALPLTPPTLRAVLRSLLVLRRTL